MAAPTIPTSLPQDAVVIPVTSDGQPQLYWSERTLCRALDIGRTVLWQRISTGAFPPPEKMPDDKGNRGRSNRWDVRKLLRWLDAGSPHYQSWMETGNKAA
jgi:hypothetical protein